MLRFILKRLILMIPMLFGITLVSFFVIHLTPGEPGIMELEMTPKVTKEARERIRAYYGLDKPLHVQYWMWLKRVIKLDFGESFSPDRRPVIDKIKERLPVTVSINLVSMAIIFLFGIPLGIVSARYKDSVLDKSIVAVTFAFYAAPTFWIALLLMLLFGVYLEILPVSGLRSFNYEEMNLYERILDLAKHLVLPIFVSASGGIAAVSRFMKNSLLEVLSQDYIRTAYSKGLPESLILRKHALRNALLPVLTLIGLSVPGLIGGSVIFESIFSIPGMGQLFYMSVMARDYPTIMGILVMGAFLTLLGNLLADICYAIFDPRIRVE